MPGALDGIRVVDFGQYIAGPLAGMLLADQGADVIKVDPPGGPRWETAGNATWNRGKRSIVLDLKWADGQAAARGLVESADVVVENFRPGVMDRLGLGPADMTTANPRLVYCSLPGFASDDPRAGVPAYEGVVAAAAATFLVESGNNESDRPVYTALPIASTFAAFQGVVGIVMALNARERDGTGQHVEVPLFDAMFTTNAYRAMSHHDPSNGVTYPYSNGRFGEPQHYGPWNGFYRCQDGRWFYFNGSSNRNWREVVAAAGITSWDAEGLTDFTVLARDQAVAAEAIRRAEELFETRTAQEWEELVAEAGGEGALCRTSEEWIRHPHTRESGMMAQIDDPVYGKMLQPNVNVRMSRTPGNVRGPAPVPDQHREEILSGLASRRPDHGRPAAEAAVRAAVDGVRVLDLCIELAGPTLGRTMAEFGADVIKINHPGREEVVVLHNDINQGKRSILLDLQTEEGREVFWRLLEDADVVVENYRAGKLEKLGLDYEAVRKRKPDIIYASLKAYGHAGPWAGRPGHDPFVQAVTGMAVRFGGSGVPVQQPSPINDYGTGFMGAYGVALALLHRRRTGEGQLVDASLAYTALTFQSPFMQSYQGKIWDEPKGQDVLGDGPLHRAYRARDAWLFLGARTGDLPRIADVGGLEGIDLLRGEALAGALEARFPAKSVKAWVKELNAAGIGAHQVVGDFADLMFDPWVQAHGLSLTREHEEIGLLTTCGPAFRLSRTPVRAGHPAPKPGRHAHEILEDHGLGGQYQSLVDAGVIVVDGVKAG